MILRVSISIKQAAKRESQFHCRISGEVIDKFIKKTLINWISLQSRFAQIRFFILNIFFVSSSSFQTQCPPILCIIHRKL